MILSRTLSRGRFPPVAEDEATDRDEAQEAPFDGADDAGVCGAELAVQALRFGGPRLERPPLEGNREEECFVVLNTDVLHQGVEPRNEGPPLTSSKSLGGCPAGKGPNIRFRKLSSLM